MRCRGPPARTLPWFRPSARALHALPASAGLGARVQALDAHLDQVQADSDTRLGQLRQEVLDAQAAQRKRYVQDMGMIVSAVESWHTVRLRAPHPGDEAAPRCTGRRALAPSPRPWLPALQAHKGSLEELLEFASRALETKVGRRESAAQCCRREQAAGTVHLHGSATGGGSGLKPCRHCRPMDPAAHVQASSAHWQEMRDKISAKLSEADEDNAFIAQLRALLEASEEKLPDE